VLNIQESIVNEAMRMSERIQRALPHVKRGTPRFWGVWFGRPYDSDYRTISSEHNQGVLRLHFQGDERLTIWHPENLKVNESTFQICRGERVMWEWFYYGRPKTEGNRFFYDFVRSGDELVASTNVNWYTPDMKTDRSLAAFELL
jgi:hypothetical protein